MKEDKKKKKSENKIVTFEISDEVLENPEMDKFLKESLIKEADDLEAELNESPDLVGVGASDDLFQSIVGKLKEQGIWEEEDPDPEKNPEPETDSDPESEETEDLDKIYQMLPESDRRALELGRQEEKRRQIKAQKIKRLRKILKHTGFVAAMFVLVFGLSMTSEANRRLVLKTWDGLMLNLGFRVTTNYMDEMDRKESVDTEAEEAMKEISDQLGYAPLFLSYYPEGMKYQRYEIIPEQMEAVMFYFYDEEIFSVTMISQNREGSSYYALDEEPNLREVVYSDQGVKAEIWETNLNLEEETYVAEIVYGDCRYILNGIISLQEMEKMIKNIVFL